MTFINEIGILSQGNWKVYAEVTNRVKSLKKKIMIM